MSGLRQSKVLYAVVGLGTRRDYVLELLRRIELVEIDEPGGERLGGVPRLGFDKAARLGAGLGSSTGSETGGGARFLDRLGKRRWGSEAGGAMGV